MTGGQDLCGRLACPWSSCHWPWYIEFLEILQLAKGYSYFRKGQVIKLQSQGLPFFVGCSTFAPLFFLDKPPVSINGSTKMSLPSPLWLYPLSEILGTDYFLRWVEWAFLPSNFQSLRLVLWVFRWVLGTTDQWPRKATSTHSSGRRASYTCDHWLLLVLSGGGFGESFLMEKVKK